MYFWGLMTPTGSFAPVSIAFNSSITWPVRMSIRQPLRLNVGTTTIEAGRIVNNNAPRGNYLLCDSLQVVARPKYTSTPHSARRDRRWIELRTSGPRLSSGCSVNAHTASGNFIAASKASRTKSAARHCGVWSATDLSSRAEANDSTNGRASRTPLGMTLVAPLKAVRDWAEQHIEQVQAARDAHAHAPAKAPSTRDILTRSPAIGTLAAKSSHSVCD